MLYPTINERDIARRWDYVGDLLGRKDLPMLGDVGVQIANVELPIAFVTTAHYWQLAILHKRAKAPRAHPKVLSGLAGTKQTAFGLATVGRDASHCWCAF